MDPFDLAQTAIRVLLAAAFVFMGVSHFSPGPKKTMARMIPPALRGSDPRTPLRLVLFTGVCEIAGGIGLLIPFLAPAAAVALIIFLVAVFPANAYAAKHPDRFGRAAFPFWPRLIGQLILIGMIAVTLAS